MAVDSFKEVTIRKLDRGYLLTYGNNEHTVGIAKFSHLMSELLVFFGVAGDTYLKLMKELDPHAFLREMERMK